MGVVCLGGGGGGGYFNSHGYRVTVAGRLFSIRIPLVLVWFVFLGFQVSGLCRACCLAAWGFVSISIVTVYWFAIFC